MGNGGAVTRGIPPVYHRSYFSDGPLVHRSGVAILTFYALFEESLTPDDLVPLLSASLLRLATAEAPQCVWEAQIEEAGLAWSDLAVEHRFSSGVDWARFSDLKTETLSSLMEAYVDLILRTIGSPEFPWRDRFAQAWLLHPIAFIRKTTPALSDPLDPRGESLLAPLILGRTDWWRYRRDRLRELLKRDTSLTTDSVRFLGPGHSFELYLEPARTELEQEFEGEIPGQEWLARHYSASAVVELVLIQVWILEGIADRLRYRTFTTTQQLAELRREILAALDEYHRATPLSFADASDLVGSMREAMGADRLYSAVMHQLGELQHLIEAAEHKKRSRKDRLLSTATAVAALLLGLPGAWAFAERLAIWSESVESAGASDWLIWLVPVADFVSEWRIETAVGIYVALLIGLGALLTWTLVPVRIRMKPVVELDKVRPEGFRWPGSPDVHWNVPREDPERSATSTDSGGSVKAK